MLRTLGFVLCLFTVCFGKHLVPGKSDAGELKSSKNLDQDDQLVAKLQGRAGEFVTFTKPTTVTVTLSITNFPTCYTTLVANMPTCSTSTSSLDLNGRRKRSLIDTEPANPEDKQVSLTDLALSRIKASKVQDENKARATEKVDQGKVEMLVAEDFASRQNLEMLETSLEMEKRSGEEMKKITPYFFNIFGTEFTTVMNTFTQFVVNANTQTILLTTPGCVPSAFFSSNSINLC